MDINRLPAARFVDNRRNATPVCDITASSVTIRKLLLAVILLFQLFQEVRRCLSSANRCTPLVPCPLLHWTTATSCFMAKILRQPATCLPRHSLSSCACDYSCGCCCWRCCRHHQPAASAAGCSGIHTHHHRSGILGSQAET